MKEEGGRKSLYDDIISGVDGFLTNEIQAPQNKWKKCVNYKWNYIEKQTSLGHIPWIS